MSKPEKKIWGLLAEFETTKAVYHACESCRDEGFTKWDSYTPFPVHGLDKAMGLKASFIPWITLVCGLSGAALGMYLQYWVSAVEYTHIISGKPYNSFQAFVPVTFELGILLGGLSTAFGMFFVNRLPTFYHPVFNSDRFAAVTDDKFFIAIEADDPLYDPRKTKKLLKSLGATHVEELEE
jgi:hypothetical protein